MSARVDGRFWLLLGAAVLGILGAADPQVDYRRQRLDALFVVDITGSMNVRDYRADGAPQSRLDHVKTALAALIADMPCGSRAGVGVFAERRPFLLIAPVETCANYAPLAGMLQQLDWRMAWEGDSYVASGLYQSIALAAEFDTDLVFLSDGQEAPPLHWSGAAPFEGEPGAVHGLIVGVGDVIPSPIPKFDRDGRESGFLGPGDVVQENRSGTPPPDAERREGWHPRNAPWGAAAATGEEHLSAVHETHLRALAAATGLGYVRLTPGLRLDRALASHAAPRAAEARLPLAPWFAATALILLTAVWRPEHAGRRVLPSFSFRPRRPA
ncbi:MAG TPA: vWA domain-containing protein [Dokdonella sp.]|uniref:vWA domain-containing protein n=1 Tax=Dokdonella sp. TaxID=2291710 RepID=UPI002C4B25E7|nr:vWA domain-containing protein [Dokdonella sp.]HUD41536.1 vWA domain-containing protein [Dokdonella sp.]